MLQAINDRIKGWLGGLVIIMITIPFAFWGIESYLGGGGKQFAAVVNGEEIPVFQFDNAYSNQLARLNQQFGSALPFSNQQIKTQVLDQLINAVVLEDNSYSSGYRVSDSSLKQNIAALFTRDGKFDRDYFENVVASNGMTVSQYETRLRNELRVVQKQNAILASAILSDEEARQLAELTQQEREIRMIKFKVDSESDEIVVTDEEIEDYYNTNSVNYMTPERVSVEYVEIISDDLADSVDVDEDRITEMYEDYRRSMQKKEERKARHILVQLGTTEAKSKDALMPRMEEIRQRLNDGESFEDLAKEYSEDPGSAKQGGDLGWVATGEMVKSFEDTLFSMNKGEVSDVVETQFGLHLIKLDDVRTPEVQTLAEKRGEFEHELKQDVISSMFYDVSENMAVTAYENPDSLDAVVDAINKQPNKTELFTRDAGSGIADNHKFRTAAFSSAVIEQGLNSDIIEISPTHVAVLRMLKHEPASKKPLEEVRADIEEVLRLKAAHNRTMAAAEEARNKITAGASAESVLAQGQVVESPVTVKRTDLRDVDAMVVSAAFQMPYPQEGKPSVQVVNLGSGDIALVLLDKVSKPDEVTREQIDAIKQQRKNDIANADFDSVLATIKDAAEIQRNTDLLQ
ncbi:MAG: SurA N-terminal domain-containing protein [Thiotrichales bacterium]|nr:MAG: SurA N-terminal domain-containing protein [Thiotrichales bacterium]